MCQSAASPQSPRGLLAICSTWRASHLAMRCTLSWAWPGKLTVDSADGMVEPSTNEAVWSSISRELGQR
jgi:hypothetical protein